MPAVGLRASMIAETTKFSMPLPGAQVAISSRLSGFGDTRTSTKPASRQPGLDPFAGAGAGDAAAQQRRIGRQLGAAAARC